MTTEEIDRVVHEACIERECYPSPLNYHNFPNSCCTSVNEVICHGIPDLRPLEVLFTFPKIPLESKKIILFCYAAKNWLPILILSSTILILHF